MITTQEPISSALVIGDPSSKGNIFQRLNSDIPLNEYHLPDFIYRADLIPSDILDGSYTIQDKGNILNSASMRITFDHGYPSINDTTPLWDQLPCETADAFNAFMVFLELPESTNNDNPIRLLPLIAQVTKIDITQIANYCHMFYWHWRSRAYDLFLVAAHRKQREQRVMSIEGKHFKLAESLLDKVIRVANSRLDDIINSMGTDDDTDDTKLKDLIDMADRLTKIQRVSVGLAANGVSQIDLKDATPRNATATDTFKSISKGASSDATPTRRSNAMDNLLQTPDDLTMVQDLIVRMSGAVIDTTPINQHHRIQGQPIIDVDVDVDAVDEPSEVNETERAERGSAAVVRQEAAE